MATTTSECLIYFYFEGIVALCVSQDPARRDHFSAGIIKGVNSNAEIQDHTHSIEIWKLKDLKSRVFTRLARYDINGKITGNIGDGNPARLLNLVIKNMPAAPNVRLLRPSGTIGDLDRVAAVAGFDWVLDVEADLHGEEVELNSNALRTVLRVTGVREGIFYAPDMGDGVIFTKNAQGNPDVKAFFGAAESVAAVVPLPSAGADLSIKKKDNSVETIPLPYEEGTIYHVNMVNTCNEKGCQITDVTEFYNDLHNGGVSGARKVIFYAPRFPLTEEDRELLAAIDLEILATPLTQCTVPDFGLRDNLPDPA